MLEINKKNPQSLFRKQNQPMLQASRRQLMPIDRVHWSAHKFIVGELYKQVIKLETNQPILKVSLSSFFTRMKIIPAMTN